MNRLLLLLILSLSYSTATAQMGYLFVKKGYKKKRTYTEGDRIMLLGIDGFVYSGLITQLKNDTIYLNGRPIPRPQVKAVLFNRKKNKFPADVKTLLLIGGGSALTTLGLTINKRETFQRALTAGLVIGYAPLIAKYLGNGFLLSLQRKQFKVGKKFQLQIIDFHLPNKRAF